MIKQDAHLIKGLQKDLTVSKFSNEFAFDAQNIRITAKDGNNLLSITNEKGNKEIPLKDSNGYRIESLKGTVIGYNVLNNYLTLFTTTGSTSSSGTDRIYRLEDKGDYFTVVKLFEETLGLDNAHPIESIGVYENENVQKVYWVDGKNQPRVINIVKDKLYGNKPEYQSTSFDFVQELNLKEEITIEKIPLGNGIFSPGTIQYAFSYYNKYGQESNIFRVSELCYVSNINRGNSPEDKVSNSFGITVTSIDERFEYIRIYSIHRTSIDATPTVTKVIDLPINGSSIYYVDNGTEGETIDPTQLLYIGGESIVAGTITSKDNTLFLGNITLQKPSLEEEDKTFIKNNIIISYNHRTEAFNSTFDDAYYNYYHQLNNGNTSSFKAGEHYRIGIQFQYKNGKWSDPIHIQDYTVPDGARPLTSGNTLSLIQLEYTLTNDLKVKLKDLEFKKARAVVVFPSLNDRKIITQGLICPTVFRAGSRRSNTPFSQSSWFIRPNLPWDVDSLDENNAKIDNNQNIDKGAWVEFRHLQPLKLKLDGRACEVFNIEYWDEDGKAYTPSFPMTNTIMSDNEEDKYSDMFFVDQSVLTLHSPDIEFDSSLSSLDSSNLKLRIVGIANFTASIGDIDIQTSTPTIKETATGFVKRSLGVINKSNLAARSLVSGLFYRDYLVDDNNGNFEASSMQDYEYSFLICPWHRQGSLNNDIIRPDGKGTRSAVLKTKKISNLKFSEYNSWFDTDKYWKAFEKDNNIKTGITQVQLFNSDEVSLIKMPVPDNSRIASMNYYGNIDTLLPALNEYSVHFTRGKCITGRNGNCTDKYTESTFFDTKFFRTGNSIGDDYTTLNKSRDPVRMKYKSSPHFVLCLNYSIKTGSQIILPSLNKLNEYSSDYKVTPFWCKGESKKKVYVYFLSSDEPTVSRNTSYYWIKISEDSDEYGNLYIYDAEDKVWYEETNVGDYIYVYGYRTGNPIYYEVITDNESYTLKKLDIDDSESYTIHQDNIDYKPEYPFLYIGELYREDDDLKNSFGELESCQWLPAGKSVSIDSPTVPLTYGDTWYQRYDCLKTYPYTQEDENQIVEIASFMCETRVNIDGRYDRNRGQISNLNMSPTNFNLINPIYSQKDNFFTYRILDEDYYKLNIFPNSITWSKEKSLAETVDTWTNITMASTLDLNGDKGEIVSLNTFNNEIYCFQKKGLSNILFNPRVQIPASDGVPIEITNGFKVSGKRYVSETLGCNNKWSIAESPSGLYFIDNITNGIYLFNGQINSLSDTLGFNYWISTYNSLDSWNPQFLGNSFVSYYDSNNKDVYFVNNETALVFSEALNQFTSFMDYEQVPAMFNINNNFFAIQNGKIWKQFEGDYNMFFGTYKPYGFTIISNADGPFDKIFNNVEFRADCWKNNELLSNCAFDKLEVWNEYQKGITSLNMMTAKPSSLKKKFRVWRANIPRANTDWNGIKANKMDRIRNTWAYIKLSRETENTDKMEFHDMMVYYFL